MKRRSGRYDTNSYDTFTDGDSDSYQRCYHIFSACAAFCNLSRQQENAQVARTHRKVAPGYDNVDTYNLLPEGLLLLITNTDFGKKKGKKDKDTDGENAENKTDSKKIEVVTSPEDIITDEKEERKI